jgi:hypothetical protein
MDNSLSNKRPKLVSEWSSLNDRLHLMIYRMARIK